MAYALFAGQPMSFLGPTGLTLAFTAALFNFTTSKGFPFLPLYSWTGLWTSFFLSCVAVFNHADLIQYCTRFTDDCFNALLSTNFVFQASASLLRNFTLPSSNLIRAFASLNMALVTWSSTKLVDSTRFTTFFNKKWRRLISDFGPTAVILLMTFIGQLEFIKGACDIQTLNLPKAFALAGNRPWIPALRSVPMSMRLACSIPALLLTMLFYLDQNISVRTVNNQPGLKKGSAFHLDMLVLAAIVGGLSFFGLPWVCGATVQSMNHVRSMTDYKVDSEGNETVVKVTESRVSGFAVHSGILASLSLLPLLSYIPLPVVSGIFLFIGFKMMKNNLLLNRATDTFRQRSKLSPDNAFRQLPKATVLKYVGLQMLLLSIVWLLKESRKFSLFFPSCIAVMVLMRFTLLPKIFNEKELEILDPDF